jgi:hypothetical protein
MSEVILEKSNNVRRRACLIRHPDVARARTHWPLAFSHPEDLTNTCRLENKKFAVLKRLGHANEKLKVVGKEINEAVLAALDLNRTGDNIADQIVATVVTQGAIRKHRSFKGLSLNKDRIPHFYLETWMLNKRRRKKWDYIKRTLASMRILSS